jgi:catechol 2,3-dioxygenase-like lactoylglutathione lyase family enzyme
MPQLNHTIVWCTDPARSSEYLCSVLGLQPARSFGHFLVVDMANGVSLDFMKHDAPIARQHYAFLVSDAEFDRAFNVIQERGQTYWSDPAREKAGEINRHWGGRGVYFEDPDGHLLELITKPYGAMEDL